MNPFCAPPQLLGRGITVAHVLSENVLGK